MKNISVIKVLICAAVLVALLSPVQTVSAGQPTTIFEVDTFEDLVDIYPNGICSVGDFNGGPCSLRAAIYDATQLTPPEKICASCCLPARMNSPKQKKAA